MNKNDTICIVTHNGKEIGRIAVTAANAAKYIENLAIRHGGVQVKYVEDKDEAMISRMIRKGWQPN